MNFKTCKGIHDNFILDDKFAVSLAVYDESNKIKKTISVTDPGEKGYIYAALFFHEEIKKEVDKLIKRVNEIRDEVLTDMANIEVSMLLAEVSMRVSEIVGSDSLDAMVKEILAQNEKHIALIPDAEEINKYNIVLESILTETLADFFKMVFLDGKASESGVEVTLPSKYVNSLTDRQKKLFAPAVRMVGFLNKTKVNKLELSTDWSTMHYIPENMTESFAPVEEKIKESLKKMITSNNN